MFRIAEAIRDSRYLRHFGHVVNTHNMRAIQDTCGNRCSRAPDALFWRRRFTVKGQRSAKEALARCAHQQRVSELRKLWEFLQQFVLLRKALAEADPRVEDALRFRDARPSAGRTGL